MASRIIYKWRTWRGEIKRLRLEVVNGEILQRVFVVEDIDYARNSEGMRDYRNNVIFYIGRYVRFDWFSINDIAQFNSITIFVGNWKSKKGTFICVIFLNTTKFEKSVLGNIWDYRCKLVFLMGLSEDKLYKNVVLKKAVTIVSCQCDAYMFTQQLLFEW